MARYGIIENDIVVNVVVGPDNWSPAGIQVVAETTGCVIGATYANGIFTPPAAPTPPAVSAADAKAVKLAEINAKAQSDVAPYTNPYPKFEIDSWPQQAQEAAAYAADNTVATPWCDLAASKRGIDRVTFLGKVQAKAQAFIQISATVAGYRQGLEDQLDAIDLTASDAVAQIAAVTYTSPLAAS